MADHPNKQPGHHSEKWWKRHPEKQRPESDSTKKSPRKPNSKGQKFTKGKRDKLAAVFTLLGLAAAFGSWGYFVIAQAPSLYFGLSLVGLALLFCAAAYWQFFDWTLEIKIPILACLLVLSGFGAIWWARYEVRPSFTFVVPGVVLGDNSWDFIINHRGPKSSESVQILFVDKDKQGSILAAHPQLLTPHDIDDYQRILSYPEINPRGRGSVFAIQFPWTPLNLSHEHYSMDITTKERNIHQELQIENVRGEWVWATQIKDAESGKQLLNCKDKKFPYGDPAPVTCFPEILRYGD